MTKIMSAEGLKPGDTVFRVDRGVLDMADCVTNVGILRECCVGPSNYIRTEFVVVWIEPVGNYSAFFDVELSFYIDQAQKNLFPFAVKPTEDELVLYTLAGVV